MLKTFVNGVNSLFAKGLAWFERKLRIWTQPTLPSLVLDTVGDLRRDKSELVWENALLRQQLIVMKRSVKQPKMTNTDRRILVVLASRLRAWQSALLLVKPNTLLQWHKQLFKLVWRRKSAIRVGRPHLSEETIALIKRMALDNPLWGAERIRGELLKLDVHVCKRTIQKYIRQVRTNRPTSQTWTTFVHNHAADIWACDFLPVFSLFFKQYFVFFIIELASRRVIHLGVTDAPTDAWVAQQLREATPFDQKPKYLIRDNDSKFGQQFARVAAETSIKILKTPIAAPNANAICERFLESVRHECLDHLLVLSQRHLHRMVKAYVLYFNQQRPHQGIDQSIPIPSQTVPTNPNQGKTIQASPILGGLHTVYQWAA